MPDGYDLGWRYVTYDLISFLGQSVKLWFEVRNLHHDLSFGIWAYVDDVRVVDAGPPATPPGDAQVYLPAVQNARCDSLSATRNSLPLRP